MASHSLPSLAFKALYEASRNSDLIPMNRFSLAEMIRQAERRRVVDGDVFILKLRDGRLQLIESDLVRSPSGDVQSIYEAEPNEVQGVRLSANGRALNYALHKRIWNSNTIGWY